MNDKLEELSSRLDHLESKVSDITELFDHDCVQESICVDSRLGCRLVGTIADLEDINADLGYLAGELSSTDVSSQTFLVTLGEDAVELKDKLVKLIKR